MLGLNFHIFWMRFATDLDIKLFSEKIEKDFQFTGAGGGVTRPYRAFPGAGGGVTHPWKSKPYIIQWRPRT